MYDRFGEVFEVVSRDTFDSTYGLNPWEGKDQCITSIDFAKQESILPTLRDVRWDLIIVDEAHKMAAYRYGSETKKTDRYQLGEVLSGNGGALLFLTATPHRGDPENFRLLLALLDQDLYATTGILGEAVTVGDNPNFLRRMKEDMRDFDGKPLFPPRHVTTLPYDLSEPETTLYEAVTQYVEVGLGAADLAGNRNVGLALTIPPAPAGLQCLCYPPIAGAPSRPAPTAAGGGPSRYRHPGPGASRPHLRGGRPRRDDRGGDVAGRAADARIPYPGAVAR
jgi:hypothetical protein